jgi:hypothetical protein
MANEYENVVRRIENESICYSQNYTIERIAWINSKPDLEFIKNISTTIGQNPYPASQIHYWGNFKEEYNIDTVMADDRYSYRFDFDTRPLNVPELFPTVEKVLTSFNITR